MKCHAQAAAAAALGSTVRNPPDVSDFRSRRKAMAVLAIVNTAGVPAAIYMPFLPNDRALVLAILYATLCSVLFFLHLRDGYREAVADVRLSEEFGNAGVLRGRLLVSILLPMLLGGFGFYSASFVISGGYTYVAGSASDERFTVSSSHWSSGKYGDCYDTRFLEQPRIFQLWRAICLPQKLNVGDKVSVFGKASALGTVASRVTKADS
jgi:hypothetical protein